MTQGNTSASEQLSASANELAALARELESTMAFFKLEAGASEEPKAAAPKKAAPAAPKTAASKASKPTAAKAPEKPAKAAAPKPKPKAEGGFAFDLGEPENDVLDKEFERTSAA